MKRIVSHHELSQHNSPNDLWLAIDGQVYDFSTYVNDHPGGISPILQHAGRDATAAYSQVHGASIVRSAVPPVSHLGTLAAAPAAAAAPSAPAALAFDDRGVTPAALGDAGHPGQPAAAHGPDSSPAKTNDDERTSPSPSVPRPAPPRVSGSPPLEALISAHDFESAAAARMSPKAWAFVSSAATDLHTKRRNSSAYAAIGLRPRVLVDVSRVDTRAAVLGGAQTSLPVFAAPTAMARLVHPEGEKALARACRRAGIAMCVSTSASFPLGEIVAAARKGQSPGNAGVEAGVSTSGAGAEAEEQVPPLFLQLYVDKQRHKSEALLAQARSLGLGAVFVTVDAPIPGKREADERLVADSTIISPISGAQAGNDSKGGALGRVMGGFIDASLSWSDLTWLRAAAGPGTKLVLKGVQTWMDAARAADTGLIDGIVLSNHGGRSVDTSPPPVLLLLELRRNCPHVFGRLDVYVDGGVSRGTDIFKALCLGARAVGLGRGLLYGLSYGEEGVVRYLDILRDELETTMKMCGVTAISQLHPGLVNTRAVDHLIPAELASSSDPPAPFKSRL